MSEVQSASKTFGGEKMFFQPPVQFADDSVKQIMRVESVALRNFVDRIEPGLRAMQICDRHGSIQRNHR